LEVAIVTKRDSQSQFGIRWFGSLAAAPFAMLIAGCSQDGAGSIDIGDPQAVRAKAEGGLATKEPVSQKQAAALKAEEEAAKKNPKLH
jgi:hypothetical protein